MSAPPKCFHCDRTWPTERERELAAEVERLRAELALANAEVDRLTARERVERHGRSNALEEVERLRAAKDDALRRVASLCAEVERIARERDARPVPHGPECPCMRCRCGS